MTQNFAFNANIDYKLFDEDGNLKGNWKTHNRTMNELLQEAIDALETGTFNNPAVAVGIGTGDSQNAADTALDSIVSHVSGADGYTQESTTSAGNLVVTATFTGITGTPTITEAGLCGDSSASDHMYFYDDNISVAIGGTSDTLQITWTISARET